MTRRNFFLLAPVVLLVACEPARSSTHPDPTTSPAKPPAGHPEIHRNPQPPVVVKILGPERVQPGETITLELRIEALQTSEPLALRLQVPSGAQLLEGSTEETLSAAPQITRLLRLRVEQVPPEDLSVEVIQRGSGWGVRATASYRFGRPEPTLPQADAQAVRRPGISGAAIPIPRK
jgi:hypothetical protein